MWVGRIRSRLFFSAGLTVELPEGFVPESSTLESILYCAVITSLRVAADRGGSDYRAAVYNGTAPHRNRTSSESGGDSPISWTLVKATP